MTGKNEETIVAVVLADGFGDQFGPLVDDRPQCLLPVANRPLIDYTLDSLTRSGVHQTIVYCTQKTATVKDHVRNRKNVTVISNVDSRSLGDAMRDLDGKAVFRDHFILVPDGGFVGNVDLGAILKNHKSRAKNEDKNSAVTLVMKEAISGNGLRTATEEVLLTTTKKGRILHYSKPEGRKKFNFPLEIFGDEVDLHFDLVHGGVAICSPSVPPLFSDNFDCQTLEEFIKGTIEDDLTDHTLYTHVVSDHGYLAKISDFETLMTLNRDVLNRWAYPQVPTYKMCKNNVYKTSTTSLHRDCHLEEETIVGASSHVGSKSSITRSSIGNGCNIGSDVVIRNCILLENVLIADRCRLEGCVIGAGVKIGADCVVSWRSVLGPGVEISSGTVVPEDTWLSSSGTSQFGPKAFHFKVDESDDDDDDVEVQNLWGTIARSNHEDEESTDSDDESDISGLADQTNLAQGDILMDVDAKLEIFREEVLESLQRGAEEGININNLVLEINSSRHAYAVTTSQVIQTVIYSVLQISIPGGSGVSARVLLKDIKNNLQSFSGVIDKYVKNVNSEFDLLKGLEKFFKKNDAHIAVVGQVVHHMYDMDIVTEPAIMRWNESIGDDADDTDDEDNIKDFGVKLKGKLKPFIEWLEQEDDSSDDSD